MQIVEFDVVEEAHGDPIGVPLREAQRIPADSKVASIIRGDTMILPRGDEVIRPGDRVVVIGSPRAARAWSELLSPGGATVRDVVVYGAGRVGTAIARMLLEQGIAVRLIEADRRAGARGGRGAAAARASTTRPASTPTSSSASGSGTHRWPCSPCATTRRTSSRRRSPRCTASRSRSRSCTSRVSREVYEHSGVDVTVNPRQVTAEEIVRFAHDPRTQQVAMLEGDRFEVLDIVVRAESEYVGQALPRDADPGRADRRDRAERRGDLPARRRRARGGRPGDHLHRVVARAHGRESSVSPTRSGRIRPPRRLALELGAALALDGHARQVPQPRRALPGRARRRLRRAGLAVPRRRRARRRRRSRHWSRPAAAAAGVLGFREGYLVVSLTWLLAAAFAASIYLLSGEPQLDRPVDAYFESMSGFTTTGAQCAHGRRGARPLAADVAPVHPVARRAWGSSCSRSPCCRDCASAAASCSSPSCPARRSISSRSGSGRRRSGSGCSTSASPPTQALILTLLGWTGVDDEMDLYDAPSRTPSRRCRPAASARRRGRSSRSGPPPSG